MSQQFLTNRDNVIQVGGSPISLGQKTGASSLPVTIASDQTLPLPSSAATSTKQSDGTQKTQVVDGSGNVISATSNALNINTASGVGEAFSISLTPTVGTAAYIAGDSIGGVLTFASASSTSGRSIVIDSIALVDKGQQSLPVTFQWFRATPTGGTYTDGSPLVYASTDYTTYAGQTRFTTADWLSYPATPTDAFASKNDLQTTLPITATSLFALLIADSSFSLTAGDIIITLSGRRL